MFTPQLFLTFDHARIYLREYPAREGSVFGKWLLCDFHIHTDLSDGSLPLREVVNLYGEQGFDVIAITDHALDTGTRERLRSGGEKKYALWEEEFDGYLQTLWQEAQRAWETYNLIVIPGVELTNNTDDYHILALDVKKYIDPGMPVERIIEQIHSQGAIAVACHPHHKYSDSTHSSLYLWERYDQYAPLFDAWEVANRDDLFNVVGLKKSNYIANSDFHELWHLYSWKTLIYADKNTEAVKQAIRRNRNIAIHLFRKEKEIQL
jgi:predicted metal-dependent phosphoesterase TrpH